MIRRFLTRILMVVLLAACGYNWWQVRRLQAEVGELRTRLAVPARRPPSDAGWPATEQELRRRANGWKDALDGTRSQRTLRGLQARTEQLRRQADALRRESYSMAGRHSP